MPEDSPVVIRRQWNSYLEAVVPLSAISGVHWSDISGGVFARASRSFLHGYVSCDAIEEGVLNHSCRHGRGPHRIKVCIVQRVNDRAVFQELKSAAGGS
jgi:hypothetical protein